MSAVTQARQCPKTTAPSTVSHATCEPWITYLAYVASYRAAGPLRVVRRPVRKACSAAFSARAMAWP
jgi:hypothetical protein